MIIPEDRVFSFFQTIDYDYHEALTRATAAYREIEHSLCKAISGSADKLNDEAKELDFVNDRAAFMQDNQNLFTPPPAVQFVPFAEDDVSLWHDLCTYVANVTHIECIWFRMFNDATLYNAHAEFQILSTKTFDCEEKVVKILISYCTKKNMVNKESLISKY